MTLMTFSWSPRVARCMQLYPLTFGRRGLAPFEMRRSTIPWCPDLEAKWRGVSPVRSCMFRSGKLLTELIRARITYRTEMVTNSAICATWTHSHLFYATFRGHPQSRPSLFIHRVRVAARLQKSLHTTRHMTTSIPLYT